MKELNLIVAHSLKLSSNRAVFEATVKSLFSTFKHPATCATKLTGIKWSICYQERTVQLNL